MLLVPSLALSIPYTEIENEEGIYRTIFIDFEDMDHWSYYTNWSPIQFQHGSCNGGGEPGIHIVEDRCHWTGTLNSPLFRSETTSLPGRGTLFVDVSIRYVWGQVDVRIAGHNIDSGSHRSFLFTEDHYTLRGVGGIISNRRVIKVKGRDIDNLRLELYSQTEVTFDDVRFTWHYVDPAWESRIEELDRLTSLSQSLITSYTANLNDRKLINNLRGVFTAIIEATISAGTVTIPSGDVENLRNQVQNLLADLPCTPQISQESRDNLALFLSQLDNLQGSEGVLAVKAIKDLSEAAIAAIDEVLNYKVSDFPENIEDEISALAREVENYKSEKSSLQAKITRIENL